MHRIVHFTNTFAPFVGGIERAVARLVDDHTHSGHFCRVVTPAFEGAQHSADGILRTPAITGIGRNKFSIRLPMASKVDHWMEAIEPTILHAHQPFMLGDTAWRIAREWGSPLIFTHHTLYERYAEMALLDREKAAAFMLTLTTLFANRCDLCVAPTESIKRLMIERGIERPIEVAPTGIELEPHFRADGQRFRERFGLQPDVPVVGHLGRITGAKNIDFLVDAVVRMLASDPNLWFLLVGDGDKLEPALQRLRKAGFGGRVVSTGSLGGQDVADAYAAMDLFLFTSRTDTQGLVLAESMASGTPVVALDAPGARDCIVHDKCGLLLDANSSAEAFASATLRLLDDVDRKRRFVVGSREHVRQFGHQNCSQRMLDLYDDLARTHKPRVREPESLWEGLVESLEAEIRLLQEKVNAAEKAFGGGRQSPRK